MAAGMMGRMMLDMVVLGRTLGKMVGSKGGMAE